MLQYIPVIGGVINVIGGSAYIRDTMKGRTKPNRVTFLIWSIAPCITSAAAFSDGVTWVLLPIVASGVMPFLIVIASFFNKAARWELFWYDYLCGLFSVLALILWKVTHDLDVAIFFAILSDGFAALPTLKKSWAAPETETLSAHALAIVAGLTSFFAISKWKFTAYAWPVYTVVLMTMISLVILYRRKVLDKAELGSAKG